MILTTSDITEDSDSGESSEGSKGNTSDNGLWIIVGGAVTLLILVVIAVLYVKRSTDKNGQFPNVNARQKMITSDEDLVDLFLSEMFCARIQFKHIAVLLIYQTIFWIITRLFCCVNQIGDHNKKRPKTKMSIKKRKNNVNVLD